jgi:hypothetical protein
MKIVLEIGGPTNHEAWDREAIRRTADVIDAVDVHFYPNHQPTPDPMQVVAGADAIPSLLSRVRRMIREEAPARANAIGVIVGEWDGVSDPPRPGPPQPGRAYAQWSMPNALFYGVAVGEMLLGGVEAAMYYEVQGYRFGAVPGSACTPADLRIRRPKELALRLYRDHFGDRLVAVTPGSVPSFRSSGPTNWDGFAGEAPYVRTYASLGDEGRVLALVVINRHPRERAEVRFDLRGFDPRERAQAWELAGDSMMATNENVGGPVDAVRITERTAAVAGRQWTFLAAAHSVTALVLQAREGQGDAGAGGEDEHPPPNGEGGTKWHACGTGAGGVLVAALLVLLYRRWRAATPRGTASRSTRRRET